MLYSAEHNCLIYKANPLLTKTEGWRRVNGDYIAVPAILGNLQILRQISFPVVGPMEIGGYNWPIRYPWRVLDHQRTTANFLVLNPRSFCFNDMGTMKTLSVLWAADFLMREAEKKNERFRCLVVAPLSILKSVWGSHIFNHFAGRRLYRVLHGSHEKRREELAKPADFYIINHDGLGCGVPSDSRKPLYGLAKDLAARTDIKCVVFDEASAYRNAGTKRHRAARAAVGARPYVWLLTGTPTPNGPTDAYGLGKLANTTAGESFKSFQDRTMMYVAPWTWVPRTNATEVVNQVLSPAIRFTRETAGLENYALPPEERHVPLSPEQNHSWHALKKEAVLALKSGELVHAVNEAALRIKLIQVAAGCVYDQTHQSHDLNPSARLAEVHAIISETERKIIIFAGLTNVLNLLYSKLSKHERVILNGQTSQRDRDQILREFADPRSPLRICLADPATTAHGINAFVTASVCIWYCPTDKNELYQQGIKRIDRPGQTGPVKVIRLVSTKLEQDIYARLDRNETMQGLILKFAEEK